MYHLCYIIDNAFSKEVKVKYNECTLTMIVMNIILKLC